MIEGRNNKNYWVVLIKKLYLCSQLYCLYISYYFVKWSIDIYFSFLKMVIIYIIFSF